MSVTNLMIPEAIYFISPALIFSFWKGNLVQYLEVLLPSILPKQDFTTTCTLHSTTTEEHGEGTHKAGGATYYQLSMEGNHDNAMSLNYQEP